MKGEHQLRDLIKGKNGEFDLAAESLAYKGYITNELAGKGKAWRNAITEAGRAHLDELEHDKTACPNVPRAPPFRGARTQ